MNLRSPLSASLFGPGRNAIGTRGIQVAGLIAALLPSAWTAAAQQDDWHNRPEVACDILKTPGMTEGTWNDNLWPGGKVYYVFSSNTTASMRSAMLVSMSDLEAACGVQFIPRTTQDNYLFIQNGSGNNSYVGMQDFPAQTINIFNWNREFIMCHELMHALGLWHEQSRVDRGDFVTINYDNIQDQYEHNFNLHEFAAPTGNFDFDSVMLYGACSFSVCCPTGTVCPCDISCAAIQALPQWEAYQDLMGQRTHLSEGDVAGLLSRYPFNCGLTFSTPVTQGFLSACKYTITQPFTVASSTMLDFTWYARPDSAAEWEQVWSVLQTFEPGSRSVSLTRDFPIGGVNEQIRLDWTGSTCGSQIITDVSLTGWTISAQPQSVYKCKATNVVFSTFATGSGTPSYQWQMDALPGSDSWITLNDGSFPVFVGTTATVANVNTPSLLVVNADPALTGHHFRCIISMPCSSMTSEAAMLSMCLSDMNCDQVSDLGDFFDFFNAFDSGAIGADLNVDGTVDLTDYFAFFNGFDIGC